MTSLWTAGPVASAGPDGGSLAAARNDPRRTLSPAASAHLMQLLTARSWTLAEWFAAAAERGYQAPDHLVAELLDFARANDAHREHIMRLTGPRGQWMATQNPDWTGLIRHRARNDELWLHGSHHERLQWFTHTRTIDPGTALTELERTWDCERGEQRAAFVGLLAIGLNDADAALLERALDDRRKDVRQQAIQLLRQLPASPFSARMAARAQTWIRVEKKPLRTRLVVSMPGSLDAAARRDGIEDVHFKNKGIRRWWLRMVVTATPLPVWEAMIGSASAALQIQIEDQWREVMREAWTSATALQRNEKWASAFLHLEGRTVERRVVPFVPTFVLLGYIRTGRADDYLLNVEGSALLDVLPHPWPHDIAQRVIDRLEMVAGRHSESGNAIGQFSRQNHHTTLRSAETHFPFSAAPLLDASAERATDPGWRLAFSTAAFNIARRKAMLEEFSRPPSPGQGVPTPGARPPGF